MSGSNELPNRMEQLETMMAFHERTIEELNEAMTAQWAEIDLLKREVANLRNQLREVEANPALASLPEPPPPHY